MQAAITNHNTVANDEGGNSNMNIFDPKINNAAFLFIILQNQNSVKIPTQTYRSGSVVSLLC